MLLIALLELCEREIVLPQACIEHRKRCRRDAFMRGPLCEDIQQLQCLVPLPRYRIDMAEARNSPCKASTREVHCLVKFCDRLLIHFLAEIRRPKDVVRIEVVRVQVERLSQLFYCAVV